MRKLLIVVSMLLVVFGASASYETWTDPSTGIKWEYTEQSDGTVSLEECSTTSGHPTGNLIVPSIINGKSVTSIGTLAFYNCSGLTSVTIPSTVTSVGGYAFYGCSGLTSLAIPSSVTSIGGYAFYGCSGLTSVTIPSSVTSIGSDAFYNCSGLTSVTIPSSVTSIERGAFSGCSGLKSVTIPEGITSIGVRAFDRCAGLTSVAIPSSVTSVGENAFWGCSGLTSVTIPSSVTSIGSDAFSNCSGLTSVYIDDLVAWCEIDFEDACSNPLCYAKKLYLNGKEIFHLSIPEGVSAIGQYAFYNCEHFFSATIQSNVTSIGECAFSGCSGLASVTIPESVTNIGECAFSGCSGLTSVTILSGAMSIGSEAFDWCSELVAVHIDDLVAWCGIDFVSSSANPLSWANKLYLNGKEVVCLNIPTGLKEIKPYAFSGCNGLTSVTIPEGVMSIGDGAFESWGNTLASVAIPSSVMSVGDRAFDGCGGIKAVVMPGRFVMHDVFPSSYAKITEVTILDGKEELQEEVFAGCSALSTVVISEGVTTLGEDLFYGMANLKELTIPSTVTSIGGYALYGCTSLEVIHVSNDGDIDALKQMLYESGFDVESVTFDHVEEPVYVYYKVAFDAQGGVAKWTETEVREGKPIGELPTVERDGYEFLGWFTAAVGGTQVTEVAVVAKDVTFYAHWKRVSSGADEEIVAGEKVTIETGFIGYKASGLPSGLKYDAKSGKITGAAKSATALEGVVVKFAKSGAETEELTIVVRAEEISAGCKGLSSGPLPAGVVGAADGMDIEIDSEGGTKSVSVTKLPSGMKYDKKNRKITGAPTKAGDYEIVVTVTTAYGNKESFKIPVSVEAMPVVAVGKFNGFVSVGEDYLGAFSLTTTDAGKLTAKVVTAAGTVSFSGTCWDAVVNGVYRATLTTKKGERLALTLDTTADWDANQLTGSFTTAAVAATKKTAAVPSRTYAVSAQRNAFGKTWYFAATGDEQRGWTLSAAESAKVAALTVTLKADGTTALAGKLPGLPDAKGKPVTFKVSASGAVNLGGIREGALMADFAPVLTINKVKKVLSVTTNLWLDRTTDHTGNFGRAKIAE